MEDQGCPRCKTTKYRNPSLKLLVNICGHSLCESCVDLLFIKGSGACPECGTSLRRNNFRLQLFEDPYIEKEVEIRKRVLKDFNKKEDDFDSLNQYNDYLETVESIIFNLTNNVDVEETKKQIEQYKAENKEIIKKNKYKQSKDEQYLEMLIEQEKESSQVRKQMDLEKEMMEKNAKKKSREALIDDLMFSDLSATEIMASHKSETSSQKSSMPSQPTTCFSTGIKIGMQTDFENVSQTEIKIEEYRYSPIHYEMCGPEPPSDEEVFKEGYLSNVREATDQEKGGGYHSSLACQRALLDALAGLFFFPATTQNQTQSSNPT